MRAIFSILALASITHCASVSVPAPTPSQIKTLGASNLPKGTGIPTSRPPIPNRPPLLWPDLSWHEGSKYQQPDSPIREANRKCGNESHPHPNPYEKCPKLCILFKLGWIYIHGQTNSIKIDQSAVSHTLYTELGGRSYERKGARERQKLANDKEQLSLRLKHNCRPFMRSLRPRDSKICKRWKSVIDCFDSKLKKPK